MRCTDLTNTLTLWRLGIVKSQRHLTPGSYLSTFMALSTVWLTSHTSKVEHKKKYVGNYWNPSFGPFSQVCCSITRFLCIEDVAHLNCHQFSPIYGHFNPFSPIFCRTFFAIGGCWIMMMGNHRTSVHSQCNKSASGLSHTPKRIPTFMATALLSLVDNVLCGFSL